MLRCIIIPLCLCAGEFSVACSGKSCSKKTTTTATPVRRTTKRSAIRNPAPAAFSRPTEIDNAFLPWTPGDAYAYVRTSVDESKVVTVEVLDQTRVVMGVSCVIVRSRVFVGDVIEEDAFDWYAQDDGGDV
jgi:hypothetical protein